MDNTTSCALPSRSLKVNRYQAIAGLPKVMSPTIPTWTEPARPVTGGKQPGKVPEVPPDLCVSSSDESEDETMDSDQPGSAAESEGMEMNEVDANPQHRSIGQAKELPRRCGKAVLSKSPVIIRIVLQSPLSHTDTTTLTTGDGHCLPLASDPESPVIKMSRGTAKGRVKNISSDEEEEEESQHKRQRTTNNISSEVVKSQDTKSPSSPSHDQGQSTTERPKLRRKDGRGIKEDASGESISRDANAMDVDIDRARKRPSVRSSSLESLVSKHRDIDGGRSRDSTDGDRDGYRKKQKQLKPDEKRRAGRDRPRNRTRSRSRSRSRSPRGKYDRNDERDTKTSKERRDYDDDRGTSKKIRQRESSRERRERPSHRRRDKSWSRERSRSRERERSREPKWARSRFRSKERVSRRRDNERHKRESSTASRTDAKDSGRQLLDSKQLSGHRKSDNQSGSMSDAARRFSQSITSAGSTSPNHPSTEARGQQGSLPKASSTGSLDTKILPSDPTKRRVVEENQRKRSGSEVGTPKAETDSSALLSSSPLATRRASYQPNGQNRRLSALPSDYSREFSRYQTHAVSLKRKADEINKTHSNRRLGAIVYFLSNNAFLRAFLLSDKQFAALHPQNPDLAQREAMACWESMKQFSSALSNQCRGQFQGLDGISSLLEALVFYKCHNYSNYRLHKEMQSLEQFKKPRPGNASSQDAVMINVELAIRLLQHAEDWVVVTRCLDECKTKLTADIAREQFPETFKKWCVHPEDMGQALTQGFDMEVKKREKLIVGVTDGGTHVEKERVKTFPRIQWPLGTHLHLGDLLDFADEALREYQTRNGLEYQVITPP
ncbi:hypothetical protein BG011_002062 [Mortierella polycephala]|uniref:Uncharacterized protein n=1 Tax=Mortierella polycephala TaxID=41804 RepID=A0A9P6Q443_9FUNG|nr:hypothetical protein BG011_002062 [Mortierella polycephala]